MYLECVNLSTAAVKSTKKYILVGYLEGVNSVHALEQGHLLFWCTFYCTQFLLTMITNMLIIIKYLDNGTYYLLIICLQYSLIKAKILYNV